MIKISMLFLLGVFVLLAASCSEDSKKVTGVNDNSIYSISGTISNPDNYSIQENAQLVVMWAVNSGSPDYLYIYGKGEIDAAKGTFKLSFDANPPLAALNNRRADSNSSYIGVGIIMLIEADNEIPEGKIDEELVKKAIGVVNDRGVAFRQGNFSESLGWANILPEGFSFVKGDYYQEEVHDNWAVSDTDGIELLIDTTQKKFRFPNWH